MKFRAIRNVGVVALLLACGSFSASCKKKEEAARVESKTNVELPPVAPPHLLASGQVSDPKALFERLRANVSGSTAMFFPSGVGALLERSMRFDHRVANEVDFSKPLRFAWVGGDAGAEPTLVLTLSIKNAKEVKTLLSEGRKSEAQGAGTLFTSTKDGEPTYFLSAESLLVVAPKAASTGLAPNLLGTKLNYGETLRFVARSQEERGLFVRTTGEGLSSVVAPLLLAKWKELRANLEAQGEAITKAKARPGDYGDPRVILGEADHMVVERIAEIGKAKSAELRIDLADLSSLDLRIEPTENSGTKANSPAPLLEAPADAAVAALLRSTSEERTALKNLLVERLGNGAKFPDAPKFAEMIGAFLEGRGDELVLSLHPAPYEGLFFRTKPKDASKLEKAFSLFSELASKPPIRDLLGQRFGEISGVALGTQKVDTGSVHVASFAAKVPFGLVWTNVDGDEIATLGTSATKLLEWGVRPARKLKDDFVLKPEDRWATTPSTFALLFRRGAADPATTTNVRFAANAGFDGTGYHVGFTVDEKVLRTLVSMGL